MTSVEDLARTIRDAANAGLRVAQGTVVAVVDTTHVSVDLGDRVITACRPGSVPAGCGCGRACARRVWCRGGRLVHGWRVILGGGAAVLDGGRHGHPFVLWCSRVSVRDVPRGPVHSTPGGDRDARCRQSRHLLVGYVDHGDRLHHRRIVVLHRISAGAVGRGPDDLHIRHRLTHLLLPALSLSPHPPFGGSYACPSCPRSARRRCPHCPARGGGCPDPGPRPGSRPESRVAADEHDHHRHHRQGAAPRSGEALGLPRRVPGARAERRLAAVGGRWRDCRHHRQEPAHGGDQDPPRADRRHVRKRRIPLPRAGLWVATKDGGHLRHHGEGSDALEALRSPLRRQHRAHPRAHRHRDA
jgi:hypothetical protein